MLLARGSEFEVASQSCYAPTFDSPSTKKILVCPTMGFLQMKPSNCKWNVSVRIKTTTAGPFENNPNGMLLFFTHNSHKGCLEFVICFSLLC